jgi:hypothetical protein
VSLIHVHFNVKSDRFPLHSSVIWLAAQLGKPVPRTESSAAEVRSDDPVAEVARLELEVKRLTEDACLITGRPPEVCYIYGMPGFLQPPQN